MITYSLNTHTAASFLFKRRTFSLRSRDRQIGRTPLCVATSCFLESRLYHQSPTNSHASNISCVLLAQVRKPKQRRNHGVCSSKLHSYISHSLALCQRVLPKQGRSRSLALSPHTQSCCTRGGRRIPVDDYLAWLIEPDCDGCGHPSRSPLPGKRRWADDDDISPAFISVPFLSGAEASSQKLLL